MTAPALFLAQLYTQRPQQADAIIVLCGEDGQLRAEAGLALFKLRTAPTLVLSGGRHEPPAILGADHLARYVLGEGVAPNALVVEGQSQNTREQAACVGTLEAGAKSLLLVASAYHLPRAFLTFLSASLQGDPRLIPVAANAPWHEPPPGLDRTRADLWHVELTKITEYQQRGDCASWEDGLAYLKAWEGK